MPLQPIKIEHRGQTWNGSWDQAGKVVSVHSAYGSQDVDAGRRKPEAVAAEALERLVDDWCAMSTAIAPKRRPKR